MSFSHLKETAKKNLQGNWGIAIIAMILVGLITGAPSGLGQAFGPQSFMASLLSLVSIALIPITVGYNRLYMDLSEGKHPDVDRVFYGFTGGRWGNNVLTLFLVGLFTFFWFLLLIIPGIVKSFAYSMTPYILADPDFDNLSPTEAITKSRQMMDGHKMEFFLLGLSFIGWILLIFVTFGIAAFYVGPYMTQTMAEFYYEVKGVRPVKTSSESAVEDKSKSEDPFFY